MAENLQKHGFKRDIKNAHYSAFGLSDTLSRLTITALRHYCAVFKLSHIFSLNTDKTNKCAAIDISTAAISE